MAKVGRSQNGAGSRSATADFVIVTALEEERDATLAKLGRVRKLDKGSADVHIYYHCQV